MDNGFAIVSSALDAQQTEIGVTSNNIANSQTPGYAAESAALEALPAAGDHGVGGGVEVSSIERASNIMLSANDWQAQGALANLSSLQQILTSIQNVFPIGQSSSSSSSTTTTNTGLAGQLSNFWNSWDAVAQDPSGSAARTEVVDLAQGLATTLQESSAELSQIATNGVTQLQGQVTQVNTLLGQIGTLNSSITDIDGAGGNADSVVDQLTNVIGQLAQLAGVNVNIGSDQTATVSLGGVTLVQGSNVTDVALSSSGGTYALESSPGGIALPVSSGSVAGLLAGLNQYVPQYQSALDGVADSLATTVNSQLAAGYTASGAAGGPLFTGTTASTIAVSADVAADPSLIAASSVTGAAAANDGGNAQTMAELATSQTGADSKYQDVIQSIGSVTENVNTQVSAQQAVATQTSTALQSGTGVDLDTELTNLMTFQANYQASARVLSVLDAATQSLIEAV